MFDAFFPFAPILLAAATAIALMLLAAIDRNRIVAFALVLIGLGKALYWTFQIPFAKSELISVDAMSIFASQLILGASIVVCILLMDWSKHREYVEELLMLLALSVTGALILVGANHIVTLFLGLELLSIPLFALIGFVRDKRPGIESASKYLVLSGLSAGIFLMGAALLYAASGSLVISEMFAGTGVFDVAGANIVRVVGLGMLVASFAFKLSAVPFHMWTPDVYEGAPTAITAYLSTASKIAAAVALLRIYNLAIENGIEDAVWMLQALAVLSMWVGSLLAVFQRRIKRVLAYSSVANMGYMLIGYLVTQPKGAFAVMFFLAAYSVSVLSVFCVISYVEHVRGHDATIDDLRGLAHQNPLLTTAFVVSLFSLVGVPLTAGFMGKLVLVFAGTDDGAMWLVFNLVATSVVGMYAYLRMGIAALGGEQPHTFARAGFTSTKAALAICVILLAVVGLFPDSVRYLLGTMSA